MAKLSAMDIYKHLPQTNCGDCGVPTCMAFAMQLANKQASLDQCPHVTEEAEQALAQASAPPMKTVKIGSGSNQVKVGGETVLFRHEEKFHHPTAVAIKIKDDLGKDELEKNLQKINGLNFERIGENIGVNLVGFEHTQVSADEYASQVEKISQETNYPLVLISDKSKVMEAALKVCGKDNPLIYAAHSNSWEDMANLANEYNCPLAVEAETLEDLSTLTDKIKEQGVENLVLSPQTNGISEKLKSLTKIRRLALEKSFRPLGYPVITFTESDNPFQEVAQAATQILKYSSILVMEGMENWRILPPLTVRQHIYIDPQVPNAVEAKLYEVGEPGPDSPVLFTTNFSLTYFTVEGEIENSGTPAYISVMDTEGLGVLNAYADDRLTGESVVKTIQEQKAMEKTKHNKLIIPGLVAVLRMKIQEEGGWDVIVGPEDAASIPRFFKQEWPQLMDE